MSRKTINRITMIEPENRSGRRVVLSSIGLASVAAVTHWSQPIIDTVILPAHAQTSLIGPAIDVTVTATIEIN